MSTSEESRFEPKRRIQFAFTEEQDQFRSAVRRFLNDKSPTTEVRRLMATAEGYDPAAWRQLSEDLALPWNPHTGAIWRRRIWHGRAVHRCGAVGALLCAPYFSTAVLPVNAILNAGTDSQKCSSGLPARLFPVANDEVGIRELLLTPI